MNDTTDLKNIRGLSWRSTFDIISSIVMIGAAVFLVSSHLFSRASTRPELKVPAEPVLITGAANKGSPKAPVVMIAFTDFQCPFCGRFARDVLPQLEHDYIAMGRVQLVYRHLPLPIHQHALKAAQAAECARRQGQFWPMHDRLFTAGAQLDEAGLRVIAGSLELERTVFDACLNASSALAAVSRDSEEANALGLTGTPAFLLGSRLSDGRIKVSRAFSGALPVEQFRMEIDRAMDPAKGASMWSRLFP